MLFTSRERLVSVVDASGAAVVCVARVNIDIQYAKKDVEHAGSSVCKRRRRSDGNFFF
jgi:hypothetical protein